MKRRFAWFLGLSLVASPSWAQEKTEVPPPDSGKDLPKTVEPAPVAEAPMAEAFAVAPSPYSTVSVNVEFLEWWFKGDPIPSLLNSAPNQTNGNSGTDNDPYHVSLIGRQRLDYQNVPGLRASFAVALAERWDFEVNGFLMETQNVTRYASGVNGQPFLTRPFFDTVDQLENGYDVSSSRGLSGDMTAVATNRFYGYGADIAWHSDLQNSALNKLTFGFRQVSLSENLTVTENVNAFLQPAGTQDELAFFPSSGGVFDRTTNSLRIVDSFRTRNEFIGPQLGAQWRWRRGPVTFDFLAKMAIGVNHETIDVTGNTSLLTGGNIIASGPGGILAVPNNSGRQTFNEFTMVPEVNLRLSFDLTERIKLNAGYNVLYMSSAVRPGNQIDHRINPQLVPSDVAYNPAAATTFFPRGFFRDTDFYAHGISFGMQVSY